MRIMKIGWYRNLCFAAAFIMAELPISVFAASIVFNEIAWMGTSISANHEWIELSNSGTESIDLTGWTLTASDGTPNISLQGSIVASGFFLLERTSDDTVPGIAADHIYTGALGNTGETLTLKNPSGETVDTIIGGENWANIGGDNETKQTAQRLGNNWITATGTPREATAVLGVSSGNGATVQDNTASSSPSVSPISAPSAFVPLPQSGGETSSAPRSMIVHAFVPPKGTVGADVLFSGEAEGIKSEPLLRARFRWSFGDGGSAEGKKVFHSYHYPGVYAVFLDVVSGERSTTARGEIIVAPAKLRVSRVVSGSAGLIEVANDDAEEVNLSFWHLRSAGHFFTIPANTVLLSKRSVAFPSAITRISVDTSDVALLYPNGTEAVRYEMPHPVSVSVSVSVTVAEPPVLSVLPTPPAPAKAIEVSASPQLASAPIVSASGKAAQMATDTTVFLAATVGAAGADKSGTGRWFAATVALVAVSAGGYLFVSRRTPQGTSKAEKLSEEAEEFDIVE